MVAQDWMPPAGAQLSKLEPSDSRKYAVLHF